MAMSISFYCRKGKEDRHGLSPIEASVVLNGKRTLITLPRKERPDEFKKAMESKRDNDIKRFAEVMRVNINKASLDIMECGEPLTVESLRLYMKTGGVKVYTLSSLKDDFLKYIGTRDIAKKTFAKYVFATTMFIEFTGDIQLVTLTQGMVESFIAHVGKEYSAETACGYLKKVRMMVRYAVSNGMLKKDPFALIRIRHGKPNTVFLTSNELEAIRNADLHCDRLRQVRDLFLFQTATGLSYCDMTALTNDDVRETDDGIHYIIGKRGKTGIPYCTVVMPEGVEILKKYQTLPVLSNQKYNAYLGEIGTIAGIDKKLHTHLARKTFATNLINEGYSVELIAKMLGHSNTQITQSTYAFVKPETILDFYRELNR